MAKRKVFGDRLEFMDQLADESLKRTTDESEEDIKKVIDSLNDDEEKDEELDDNEDKGSEEQEEKDDDAFEDEKHEEAASEEDLFGKKVKAKIDGVEEDVSIEQLLRAYQINKAADKRLQDAASKERELDQKMIKLMEMQNALLEKENSRKEAPVQKEEPKVDRKAKIKDALSSVFAGDEDIASEKLFEAINEHIHTETERRIAEERKNIEKIAEDKINSTAPAIQERMKWDAAVADFASDNKDIFDDPVLSNLWESNLVSLAEQGVSAKEATRKAGEAVRSWLGKYAPKQERSEEKEEKIEEKRGDSGIPSRKDRKDASKKYDASSSVSKKSKSDENDDKEMTNAEIIAAMRRKRGLPV